MPAPTKFTRKDSCTTTAPPAQPATPNVPIRTREHAFTSWSEGRRFGGRELAVSRMAGAEQVHVNVVVIPAGRQSCPFHCHLREEEHFFVLHGRCVMRSGTERHTLEPGDYVCFPAGTGVAHAFENPFEDECTLLAIGPHDRSEIAVYPDSGKAKLRAARAIVPWPQEPLGYWDGEPVDRPLDREKG